MVRSTFTVKLNGYIVPEIIQRDLNAIKKFNDKAKILLAIETDASFNDPINPASITPRSPKKTNFVTSTNPPASSNPISVSEFLSNKFTANTGEVITFTDLTSNAPTSWLWMFGDGTFSPLQNPTHSYSTSGTYSITLISGRNNSSGIVTKVNYITIL
jgi:PKD repeat protein